jgi:hypothetical protein
MTDRPDHVGTALASAELAIGRGGALLLTVAAGYRELVIAGAVPFVMPMPKRPAASSDGRRRADRRRA